MSKRTQVRLSSARDFAVMAARRNPAVNAVATVRDVAVPAYKVASGKNLPSIKKLLGLSGRRHPPGYMRPFHGRPQVGALKLPE